MFNYLKSIIKVLESSVKAAGWLYFIKVFLYGVASKISVLLAFIIIIKTVAYIMNHYPDSIPLPGADAEMEYTQVFMMLFIMIPAIFAISGLFVYLGHKMSSTYVHIYTTEIRKRLLHKEIRALKLKQYDEDERKSLLKDLIYNREPLVKRTSREVLSGAIEGVQSLTIILLMLIVVAIINPEIFLLVILALVLFTPYYIKQNYIINKRNKRRMEKIIASQNDKKTELINKKISDENDEEDVKNGLENLMLGGMDKEGNNIILQRKLASRRSLPVIYLVMGIILSYLLWDMVAGGLPINADRIGNFFILVLMLRFLAGMINTALNAARQINQEYTNMQTISGLL